MAADGELRCGLLPPPPTGLFSREVKAEEEVRAKAKKGSSQEVFELPFIGMVRPKQYPARGQPLNG